MKILFSSFLFLFLLGCEKQIEAKDKNEFKLTAINSEQVQEHIKKSKATFLEVGSESCYSCQIMGKNIEAVKNKNKKFNVIFVDVFKDATALKKFNVKAIPTQIVLDQNGKEQYRHVGVLEKSEIEDIANNYKTFSAE